MSKIVKAELFHISLPIKFVFKTSFGEIKKRDTLIIKLTTDDGIIGYGESAPLTEPVYLEETIETCKHIINDFLFPIILGRTIRPHEFVSKTSYLRGNRIAKYGVECALWVIQSLEESKSIRELIGSARKTVEIGESIGLLPTIEGTLELIQKRVDQGYKRIKLKISPGHDYQILKIIRSHYPDIDLMVDANSAYSLTNLPLFKKLDRFNLMMIEQPLGFDDIVDHSQLQKQISTPLCLDESIVSFDHALKAIRIGACKIINIKPGRIGSFYETVKINKLAKKNKVKLWCGGMLEAGVANAFNIFSASLSEFSLPADIFLSDKLFNEDIISPKICMSQPGIITVPTKAGLGFDVCEPNIKKYLIKHFTKKK